MKILEIIKVSFLIIITMILITIFNSIDKKQNRYDVNGDGEITAQDYVLIKNYIMEGE